MTYSDYTKGPRITSMDELMSQEYVLWENGTFRKIYPLGTVQSWQLRYAYMLVKAGQLYKAERRIR